MLARSCGAVPYCSHWTQLRLDDSFVADGQIKWVIGPGFDRSPDSHFDTQAGIKD
jgi:hypothetical protein